MTELLFQTIINGIIVGTIYGIIGCSLAIIYGTMRIVNFAHGEFVISGSYLSYIVVTVLGLPLLLAVPAAILFFGVVGLVIYYLIVPRLMKNDDHELPSFLAMYGVSLIIGSLLLIFFEADTRSIDLGFSPAYVKFAGLIIPKARLIAMGFGVITILCIWWVLFRTIYGKALRAAIMNRPAMGVIGLPYKRVTAAAFVVSIVLAGLTGIMTALVFPAFNPAGGMEITLIAFVVIVIGGLVNPIGAIFGGILFGLVEQLTILYGSQTLAQIISYVALIVVVYVLPNGILGGRNQ
ncbi:branched-chain amino acid ABC transporter permease [Brucella pseudogrignonensis]|jgi:branched-chain amino acid transport system permease protein|uniref:Branched-chain amino acid ABC transporter permease n=1 Tax=Brucella pseudogrignonensis TaxID=419475 RepID=A0A7Y3T8F9_9HYPH|nr:MULTISPECIES: branched-chain amino acid ABC transporter permease [Brucella]MCD4513573.1 branched-chain amino acid ABC transporter permease [Brucella pseudogrignonensis]NNV23004.1 branched-chain amino acid ABC transporter permease [Brucella pseudogrignonensis]